MRGGGKEGGKKLKLQERRNQRGGKRKSKRTHEMEAKKKGDDVLPFGFKSLNSVR